MSDFRREFLRFAMAEDVLLFGRYRTKAGRQSPYFFNAGRFDNGVALARLASFYVKALRSAGWDFDMLFGPAYKGIPLATALAMAYAQEGRRVPLAFDRKEAKDHGEGGQLIGAPIVGRVVLVDDVISAGTSVRAAVELIRHQGGVLVGVVVALDRMERGTDEVRSAVATLQEDFGVGVTAVASVDDLEQVLREDGRLPELEALQAYRHRWGSSDGSLSTI